MHVCNSNAGYGWNTRNITWMAIDICVLARILTLKSYIPVVEFSYINHLSNEKQNWRNRALYIRQHALEIPSGVAEDKETPEDKARIALFGPHHRALAIDLPPLGANRPDV